MRTASTGNVHRPRSHCFRVPWRVSRAAVCLSACLSVCVSVCLCVCLFVCLFVYPFVRPFVHPSVCIFVFRLSVCLSVCVSVCQSVCFALVSLSLSHSLSLSDSLSLSHSLSLFRSLGCSVDLVSLHGIHDDPYTKPSNPPVQAYFRSPLSTQRTMLQRVYVL